MHSHNKQTMQTIKFSVVDGDKFASGGEGSATLPFVGFFSGDCLAKDRLRSTTFTLSEEKEDKDKGRKGSKRKRKRKKGSAEEEEETGNGASARRRVVRAESRALIYEADSEHGSRHQTHAIGLFDRSTGVVHVVPTDSRLFCLRQRLKSDVSNKLKGTQALEGNGAQEDYLQGRMELTNAFGSRRSQLAMKNAEMNRVTMENVGGKGSFVSHLEDQAGGRSLPVSGEDGRRRGIAGSSSVWQGAMRKKQTGEEDCNEQLTRATNQNETPTLTTASPAGGAAKAAADAGRRQRLPYFNEAATSENAAYPWKKFLSPAEKSAIKPVAQSLVKELRKVQKQRERGKEVSEDDLPAVLASRGAYVDALIAARPAAATDLPRAIQILALSCILYIHNELFTFKKGRKGKGGESDKKDKKKRSPGMAGMKEEMAERLGVSEAAAQAFLVRFCDASEKARRSLQEEADGGRKARAPSFRSDTTGDRLKAHAIVLALMLGDWSCDGAALAFALGLPPRKLEENLKDVGCVYVSCSSLYLSVYLSIYLSIYLSLYLHLSIYPSIHLSHLSTTHQCRDMAAASRGAGESRRRRIRTLPSYKFP